jgi:hypothetical protein
LFRIESVNGELVEIRSISHEADRFRTERAELAVDRDSLPSHRVRDRGDDVDASLFNGNAKKLTPLEPYRITVLFAPAQGALHKRARVRQRRLDRSASEGRHQ